ncbi:MAG: phosphate ABC transporter substrate-binding protein [Pseudomonadota bacterium]|nr:MAG: phosphate ABC transporter substrate-binding protein [Pseudomonadota bacterium]
MRSLGITFAAGLLGVLASGAVVAAPAGDATLVWAGCGITKKAFMKELAAAYENKTGIHIDLKGGGATKGIRNAANGSIHIGGACRVSMEKDELEKNAEQVPVAWDALAVIVNKNNPVDNITFQQLRDVYKGKITNWKQLGGRDVPIELYVRRGKISGVGYMLRELVFANYEMEFTGTHVVKSSGPLEKGIVKNPNGFGTTGISSAKRRDVKILKLEGKKPNYENIKKGDYLLYRPLYLVRQRGRGDPRVDEFIKFALSNEGKAVIRKAGTVPYADALVLVMKQLDQYKRATAQGL